MVHHDLDGVESNSRLSTRRHVHVETLVPFLGHNTAAQKSHTDKQSHRHTDTQTEIQAKTQSQTKAELTAR